MSQTFECHHRIFKWSKWSPGCQMVRYLNAIWKLDSPTFWILKKWTPSCFLLYSNGQSRHRTIWNLTSKSLVSKCFRYSNGRYSDNNTISASRKFGQNSGNFSDIFVGRIKSRDQLSDAHFGVNYIQTNTVRICILDGSGIQIKDICLIIKCSSFQMASEHWTGIWMTSKKHS